MKSCNVLGKENEIEKKKKNLSNEEKFFKLVELYIVILIFSYLLLFASFIYLKIKGY